MLTTEDVESAGNSIGSEYKPLQEASMWSHEHKCGSASHDMQLDVRCKLRYCA